MSTEDAFVRGFMRGLEAGMALIRKIGKEEVETKATPVFKVNRRTKNRSRPKRQGKTWDQMTNIEKKELLDYELDAYYGRS